VRKTSDSTEVGASFFARNAAALARAAPASGAAKAGVARARRKMRVEFACASGVPRFCPVNCPAGFH